ncbi:reactive chlorine resistance oxidoreductase RclA [Pantoea septica]|uniref:reactive chlorine resistance oxidoreductase RclA n=1 Tax=Pantoea septica TaxID=472695 RepID=UPI000E9A9A3B|nr:reactive chlorine resistance oxidoreductase RclA [Pantoea septica]MBU5379414.1 pyridine nucleotide-disulfide oxidoreductase [Pantoea septica]MDU5838483.1 reactive chlorine resistance oxidoreductase RclA [Pantoea sp.]HAT23554.1 pyridine nucleotide-disulfide oxidoreductase [Pantoea septica]
MNHYQAAIIGFGKAGKTLAAALGRAGWRVAIVEKSKEMYGGTCINIGCIPTKALVHDAQTAAEFSEAMQRKAAVVELLREKNYLNLANIAQVEVIDGQAEFIDPHTLKITTEQGSSQLSADRFFINTGAEAVFPQIEGLIPGPRIVDSTGILNLSSLPKRLGILGGGYIGVEFASVFASFGSEVTLFETSSQFLAREDADVSAAIQAILQDQGVKIELNARVQSVSSDNNSVTLHTDHGDRQADVLLVATGRRPATRTLKLENADVATDTRGAIVVDKYLKTSADHIWALGDVTGGPQFTYISLDDFRIVHDQLLGKGTRTTDDRVYIPYSVFMTPTLSRIGLTEAQAREQGRNFQVVSLPVAAIPRARVVNDTRGVLKALVDNDSKKILGVALLAADSHEVINIVKTVMDAGLPYTVLRDQIFTHPTMSESLNDLFGLVKQA